jgi:general secretion pathway protein J
MGLTSDTQRSSYGRTGFTLLELLVAISLLALISIILLGGLRMGTRVWERSFDTYERREELGQARKFLRYWLAQAYPVLARADPLHPVLRFEGAGHFARMIVPAPQAIAAGGWADLTLSALPQDRGVDFVAQLRMQDHLDTSTDNVQSVLLAGVEAIELSYWDPAGSIWRTDWMDRSELPTLIRLSVRFPAGDEREWPELIVAPAVTAAFDCEYDALAQRCRGR